jgi:hypothetical protein
VARDLRRLRVGGVIIALGKAVAPNLSALGRLFKDAAMVDLNMQKVVEEKEPMLHYSRRARKQGNKERCIQEEGHRAYEWRAWDIGHRA